jgi:hypothetical protein
MEEIGLAPVVNGLAPASQRPVGLLTLQYSPSTRTCRFGSLVPTAASCTAARAPSFDHLVGDREYPWRDGEAKRLGSLQIDHKLKFCRLKDR